MLLCFTGGSCFFMMSYLACNEAKALMHHQSCSEDIENLMSSLIEPGFSVTTQHGSVAFAAFLLACCSLFCTAAKVCTVERAGWTSHRTDPAEY